MPVGKKEQRNAREGEPAGCQGDVHLLPRHGGWSLSFLFFFVFGFVDFELVFLFLDLFLFFDRGFDCRGFRS